MPENENKGQAIHQTLLEVIKEKSEIPNSSLQSGSVLKDTAQRLGTFGKRDQEQALLTAWYDQFRNGLLSWGKNLSNPDPPFCHLTDKGRVALRHLSRDPANPDGYLEYLLSVGELSPIAESYAKEALHAYNSSCFRATSVMIGCAAESLILELRDAFVARLGGLGRSVPKKMNNWRIKAVLEAIKKALDDQKGDMDAKLRESCEAYWPAFTQQIRAARNEAGHPASLESANEQTVHASLLIFPELSLLTQQIKKWLETGFK